MKNFVSKKTFYAILTCSVLLGLTLTGLQYHYGVQERGFAGASNGLNICAKRVAQSFTALMIQDFGSNYLSQSFKGMTGECFDTLKKSLLGLNASGAVVKTLDNLGSDVHWFYKKVEKISELVQEEGMDLSQSNVIAKYEEVEGLTSDLSDGVAAALATSGMYKRLSLIGIILAQIVLVFSIVGIVFARRRESQELQILNDYSKDINKSGDTISLDKIQTIMTKAFAAQPETGKLISNFITEQASRINQLEDGLMKMSTEGSERTEITLAESGEVVERDSFSFNLAINSVLEQAQEVAFRKGIIIDTELSDDFDVYGKEDTVQKILNDYIAYALGTVTGESGKVVLRSKPLGGIAYCKVKINGHGLTREEVNTLNGAARGESVIAELAPIRNQIEEQGISVAVSTKAIDSVNVSEVEFIFDRVVERKPVGTSTIVKGKKSDIKQFFRDNI